MKNSYDYKSKFLSAILLLLSFFAVTSIVAQTDTTTKQLPASSSSTKSGGGKPTPNPTPTPEPPPDTTCYSGSGCLDVSFSTSGIATNDVAKLLEKTLIQPDGKIVSVGYGAEGTVVGMVVLRQDTNGALDTTFGGTGVVLVDFTTNQDWAKSAAIQADGKIVVIGNADLQMGIARLESDGTLDASFGNGGKVMMPLGGMNDVAIQSDGKIIVAGGDSSMIVARFNVDGSLDASFGNGGVFETSVTGTRKGTASADSVSVQLVNGEERVVAGGFANDGGRGSSADFALIRLLPAGVLDPSFGNGGAVVTDFYGRPEQINHLAIDNSNGILAVGGVYTGLSPDRRAGIARYLENGALDTNFSGDGKMTLQDIYGGTTVANGVAVQLDGKIVIVGQARTTETQPSYILVARLEVNGEMDGNFGPGFLGPGVVTTLVGPTSNSANAIALQQDGKIIVSGVATLADGANGTVMRYYP